MKSEMVVW